MDRPYLCDPIRLAVLVGTVPACDGQTEGQTDGQHIRRQHIAR